MQTKIKAVLLSAGIFAAALSALAQQPWSTEKANAWYAGRPWIVGCNFTPSTAINQLEMWQADTFDPVTIDRELGWAQSIGFTSVRVFLHNLLWQQDAKGFLKRMDQFLDIAHQHHIGVTFVFLIPVGIRFPNSASSRIRNRLSIIPAGCKVRGRTS
ncbi:MAG: hypothetical protein WDN00_13470 [Limisphaerales bacterium]